MRKIKIIAWYVGFDKFFKSRKFAFTPMAVAAASNTDLGIKIAKAAEPVKDLLAGIADPVCYVVFAWGLLECMLGKGGSGITRIKYATLAFLGMNWIPVFMEALRSVKP